jgi:hypothetical protein
VHIKTGNLAREGYYSPVRDFGIIFAISRYILRQKTINLCFCWGVGEKAGKRWVKILLGLVVVSRSRIAEQYCCRLISWIGGVLWLLAASYLLWLLADVG